MAFVFQGNPDNFDIDTYLAIDNDDANGRPRLGGDMTDTDKLELSEKPITNRRTFLKTIAGVCLLSATPQSLLSSDTDDLLLKKFSDTGERLPVIGMGTWITFNVGNNIQTRNQRTQVLGTFFKLGGGLVDSSPMYGSAEEVLGYALDRLGRPPPSLFSATKVWTPFSSRGEWQIEESHKLWGLQQFDLYQIHNLVAWEHHLQTLQQHKHEGTIRYIGVTTSHGRRQQELEQIIQTQPIDFVQLTYNILDREVERRLLPAAIEKGVAVIANRPFQGGDLFFKLARKPLPKWAGDIDCQNWAGFFLKFVVSHHAITCAIPATSQVEHMIENMGALRGKLPDSTTRKRMADYVASL